MSPTEIAISAHRAAWEALEALTKIALATVPEFTLPMSYLDSRRVEPPSVMLDRVLDARSVATIELEIVRRAPPAPHEWRHPGWRGVAEVLDWDSAAHEAAAKPQELRHVRRPAPARIAGIDAAHAWPELAAAWAAAKTAATAAAAAVAVALAEAEIS